MKRKALWAILALGVVFFCGCQEGRSSLKQSYQETEIQQLDYFYYADSKVFCFENADFSYFDDGQSRFYRDSGNSYFKDAVSSSAVQEGFDSNWTYEADQTGSEEVKVAYNQQAKASDLYSYMN